jgi:integrase
MLKIFRLHKEKCSADRYDRTYRRCKCPIHVEGMLGGEMIRESLKTANWQNANQTISEAEARGKWKDDKPKSQSVKDAIAAFLLDVESRLRPASVKKYWVLLDRERTKAFSAEKHSPTLAEFCAGRGIVLLNEFDLNIMREFRQTWKDAHVAGTKKLERLRAFLRFCVESDWITTERLGMSKFPGRKGSVLLASLKPPEPTEGEDCPTLPFEPDEIARIHDGFSSFAASRKARGAAVDSDHMDRFRVLLNVMENSGLAISDAVKLDTSRVVGDRIFLRRMKTGTRVFVPLPPSVMSDLNSLKPYRGTYYFWKGEGKLDTAAGNYRRTLRKLCEHVKVTNAHPHRFRDTFAVRLLQQGVALERVSKLLGHRSIKITEQHYWPWVQSLQDQLEADVRGIWKAATPDKASADAPDQGQTAESEA